MQINVKTHYNRSEEFDYLAYMERINLDQERVSDVMMVFILLDMVLV